MQNILKDINDKIDLLENHKLYASIDSVEKLVLFMERHIYAVFDFMSLAKALQNKFAPVEQIWTPPQDKSLARFVNEIILCEESDETYDGRHMSHFEMYCLGMAEINASTNGVQEFVQLVRSKDIQFALNNSVFPSSAQKFMANTFEVVEHRPIHEIAASFCFGREKVIPHMFQALLDKMNITEAQAPVFHYYLKRHIEVDGDSHGPLAIKMLESICGEDEQKWASAKSAAISALDARMKFWDDVYQEIH